MMKLPNLAGLEGLLDLDRRGIDIRPTLLRVVTDQYLLGRAHTPDEERQFTELALRLFGETDIPTRATVATQLAPHVCTPRPIVLHLARDVLDVAEPILRLSPQLTPADLAGIVAERGPSYAAVIAKRRPPEPAPARVPPSTPHAPRVLADTPLQATTARAAAATATPATAESLTHAGASQLCELFYSAPPAERRLILTNLDFLATPLPKLPVALQPADIWRLESAALQQNTDAVVHELERMLGISRRQARRIVNDTRGEPIVVAAKALELPSDVLQRMLLFVNPRVGRSVDRVFELAALYEDISADAARRLIAFWRDADPPETQPAKHEALWQNAVENARQALADITRRTPVRRNAPAPRPNERPAGTNRR
jgi:uncharacterized protein (DUF2336 family)